MPDSAFEQRIASPGHLLVIYMKISAPPISTYCGISVPIVRFEATTVWLLTSWSKNWPRWMNVIRAVSTMAADRSAKVAKTIPISKLKNITFYENMAAFLGTDLCAF